MRTRCERITLAAEMVSNIFHLIAQTPCKFGGVTVLQSGTVVSLCARNDVNLLGLLVEAWAIFSYLGFQISVTAGSMPMINDDDPDDLIQVTFDIPE